MTTTTEPDRTTRYGSADAPARQVTWTRLGNTLGHTNTETKRAEIREAITRMTWRDPAEMAYILDSAPARQVVASLFYGRAWALEYAAVVALPVDAAGRERRLIGLAAVTGERYVLLHVGYEVIQLLHDAPTGEAAAR
jgi:hypothetical protein